MMKLGIALYAEGATDDRFLPLVISKTSKRILAQNERSPVDVQPIDLIKVKKRGLSRDECILEAAGKAINYDALIIHSDADSRTYIQTRNELFDVGYQIVQQSDERVCKNLLPIIPIRMTESWMLSDHEALRKVLNTRLSVQDLGVPERARQVEAISRPKQVLEQAMRRASAQVSRRHQHIDIGSLYEPLGREISLESLNQVPAYQQFVNDLTEVLKELNLIQL